MVKVYAPNKQYTGLSASVSFVNGVGETDNPNLIEWFKSKGYTVEEPIANQVEATVNQPIAIDDITVAEIKEKLDELGIEYGAKENKDTLYEKLMSVEV